jgi:hypothetical protein
MSCKAIAKDQAQIAKARSHGAKNGGRLMNPVVASFPRE